MVVSVFLFTLPDGSFGSAGQSWKILDLKKLVSKLEFEVVIKNINEIGTTSFNDNDILIYTSSENKEIRTFLKNNLFYLKDKIRLIPSYDILMAHEDKSFQEVWKKKEGFGNIIGKSLFDINDHILPFPKVVKSAQGAGSSGVFLVRKNSDLKKVEKAFFSKTPKNKLISIQRKIKLNREEYEKYQYRRKAFNLFIEQEFIPKLKHDFKVLVFGDRYFTLKRSIRKNDFRASGSGKFEFIVPPQEVLDYAKNIASILDNPYLSLDIAQSESGCHLIEFQGTNFGPYTLLNAPYFYKCVSGDWQKTDNSKDLEDNYAHALNQYMSNIYD
ncbi:hypothetical protein AS194_06785 [Psychrobacter piscatorii]|uniref:ATP-grasp domain-containing protein n=1 Tax=Psychrobacter piscatorii TaxID=554343 RepID=A0A0T6DSA8_9GAMM|nr:hypothetical protein AS194_06785 [Psychrobacter piscatorii]